MEQLPARLAPPQTKGHVSSAFVPDTWFIACTSRALRQKPLGVTIQGTPLVLFRGENGQAAALLDRCPHRNVPLSSGRVRGGQLECAYHGWRFDTGGACRAVPGLCGESTAKARNAPHHAVLERDGFVWVYSTPDSAPSSEPFAFPHLNDPGYSTVRRSFTVQSTVHAMVENALDVPHTAFLHGGLFRKDNPTRAEIDVVVRRSADRVEAEYIGEARPKGLVGRILAPQGGTVSHFDRFILPSISQVEYQLGNSHLFVTSAMTPRSDFETVVYAVVTFKLPVPGWLISPFVAPIALHIFKQDGWMLALQTDNIRRFGGEQYASTEIDVLGPHVWRLLKQASRRESPAEPHEQHLKMRV